VTSRRGKMRWKMKTGAHMHWPCQESKP
jgi:hypothetical protein